MRFARGGFTLIELLVVIAIIAILAAILFPLFINAKNAAGIASCQSNIKQLGIAMSIYADSSDGRLPPYDNGKSGLNRLMEKELAAGRSVRQYLFVPYSERDRFFMKVLGWRERPAYLVQLLEMRRSGGGPGPAGAKPRLTTPGL